MENKTAEQILNEKASFKQTISLDNYCCVGVPFTDALKAMEEYASLRSKELQERVERLASCLSRVLYWDNGDLPEHAIRDIKSALSGEATKEKDESLESYE